MLYWAVCEAGSALEEGEHVVYVLIRVLMVFLVFPSLEKGIMF